MNQKFYAIVECNKNRYEGKPIHFIWDKSNKWLHPTLATPKPLSYKYALKKVEKEMIKDSDIGKTIVISVSEYEKNGI